MTISAPTPEGPGSGATRTWSKTASAWMLTAVLLGAAWCVNAWALPDGSAEASFVTNTTVGHPGTTRHLTVTVTDVRAAHAIVTPRGRTMAGTWLIVELRAETLDTSFGSLLGLAQLTISERAFSATERDLTLYREQLQTGVPRSGSMAFELPEGALSGAAALQFGLHADARLDGVIEVPIDLDDLPVEDEVTLNETGWADR